MSLSDIRNNGLNPLSYLGVQSYSPVNFIKRTDDPNSNDSQNFTLGTIWLNYAVTPQRVWILTSLSAGVATWVQFANSTGVVLTLTGNTGGAVDPDAMGNINVVGDGTTITIAGNPGTNTLTASAVGTGLVQSLTGNSGGPVFPTAGNTNVVGTGVITVVGNPGTSTLTITPSGSIASSFPTDSGTATPAAGVLNIIAGNSTQHSGSTVLFTGSGNTVELNVTDGIQNTIIGNLAGNATISGSTNTGLGYNVLHATTSGNQNVCVGYLTGQAVTTGLGNTLVGAGAGDSITTGDSNSALGLVSLSSCTTGTHNTAIGAGSIGSITTGTFNTVLGYTAGGAYTGAESSNLILGVNAGVIGESNTIRIGSFAAGTGSGQQNKCFIQAIRGVTTGVNDAIAVLIDSAGQLGTVSSSERYKENIEDMDDSSESIMELRPVTFSYKSDKTSSIQYGLIAEEVADVMPDIVVYDKEGQPETVQYHVLPVLLLNELQKLHAQVAELKADLDELRENKRKRK